MEIFLNQHFASKAFPEEENSIYLHVFICERTLHSIKYQSLRRDGAGEYFSS